MNVDDVFSHIGNLGRQQWKYICLACFIHLYFPSQMLGYTFVGRKLSFTCTYDNGNGTNVTMGNACPNDDSQLCSKFDFGEDEASLVSDFLLICER